jgi:HTH-type transcriptional regulator, sugar sensing transcriptional regulator
MRHGHQIELERLGLSAVEAQIYLALLRKGGTWRASAVAATMQIPRSTVYLALNGLLNRGLVEAETGYGGRFTAVPAERALPSLVAAEREELLQRQEELLQREHVADELAQELKSQATPATTDAETKVVQVLRDPRSVLDCFNRLQREAKHCVDGITKAPLLMTGSPGGNPLQEEGQKRGVHYRSLYEKAIVEQPFVKPYLKAWIDGGEEARVFDGELPHKLMIFDRRVVMVPLIMPDAKTRALLIRHPQLAKSLTLLFEFLWAQGKPLEIQGEQTAPGLPTDLIKSAREPDHSNARINRNGRRGRPAKK